MIRLKAETEAAKRMLEKLSEGLTAANLDPIADRVMLKTLAKMVAASPKKWFGQIRSGWTITKPRPGARVLDIPLSKTTSKGTPIRQIASWIDQGTANKGQGWIYPTTAKKLYIPLKKAAADGWNPGLRYGKDYILVPRVRGIRPRYFIAPVRAESFTLFRAEAVKFVRKLMRQKRRQ